MLSILRRIVAEVMCLIYGHRPLLLPSMGGNTLIAVSYNEKEVLLNVHMCRMCNRLYWTFGNIPTLRTSMDLEAYDAHKIMSLIGATVIGPRRN